MKNYEQSEKIEMYNERLTEISKLKIIYCENKNILKNLKKEENSINKKIKRLKTLSESLSLNQLRYIIRTKIKEI